MFLIFYLLFLYIIAAGGISLGLVYDVLPTPNTFVFSMWIVLACISGILLFILSVLIMFGIGQYTDPKSKFKHFILGSAIKILISFYHIKLETIGRENIPYGEPYTVYANHKSNLDPVLIYGSISGVCTALGKKSLFKNWFLRLVARNYCALPIDRENDRAAAKSIVEAIKLVKSGLPVMIFPEGGIKSRETEDMVNLKAGAYKLAIKSNSKLVPVSIIGSSEISKVSIFTKKHIKLVYHKPITPEEYKGMNTHELGAMVEGIINEGVHAYK